MLNFIAKLPKLKAGRGRHIFSYLAAKFFEKSGINRFLGTNLVAAMVVTGIISPQVNAILSAYQVKQALQKIEITADINTESTFALPLSNFRLSQAFSAWHSGIDLVAPQNTPIHAIESGQVEYTENSFFGYGKNLMIDHNNGFKSLYAHLSQINIWPGKQITRGEIIGLVGHTGWATGDHLHLEIYYKDKVINPLDVLPLKREDIKYDNLYFQLPSTSTVGKANE